MADRKTKIILEQGMNTKNEYKVAKLVNRVLPEVDSWLKRAEVQKLLADDPNLSIEVVPQRRR